MLTAGYAASFASLFRPTPWLWLKRAAVSYRVVERRRTRCCASDSILATTMIRALVLGPCGRLSERCLHDSVTRRGLSDFGTSFRRGALPPRMRRNEPRPRIEPMFAADVNWSCWRPKSDLAGGATTRPVSSRSTIAGIMGRTRCPAEGPESDGQCGMSHLLLLATRLLPARCLEGARSRILRCRRRLFVRIASNQSRISPPVAALL